MSDNAGIQVAGVESTSDHGLPCVRIANPHGIALIHLHGAHLTHWRPTGAREVLWTSPRNAYQAGTAIRGGVPICWPWFGPHPDRPDLPAHGFARIRRWTMVGASTRADGATSVAFVLRDDPTTLALWPHRFVLRYEVTVGAALDLRLQTTSADDAPCLVGEALHTYLAVADVRAIGISGLRGAAYIDRMRASARLVEADERLTLSAETDRIYASTATCALDDPGWGRRIVIAKTGSRSTVVWNPWTAKAARMPDLGEQWPGMACIETANAGDDLVAVPPFGYHDLSAHITVESIAL